MNRRARIALAIILTGASFFLFNSFYKEARNTAITKLNGEQTIYLKRAARGIEDFLTTRTQSLDTPSKMDAIIDDDAVGKRYIRLFYEVNEGRIKSITRVDERGVILYNAPSIRTAGTDISDQKHVRARVIQMMNMLTKEMRFSPKFRADCYEEFSRQGKRELMSPMGG